jgi:hypothetical protein
VIAEAINCLKPKQIYYNARLHRELFAEFVTDEHFERLRSIDEHCARQEHDVAIIKLRYLAHLYPGADLLVTYDLLHNLDFKADLVAKELEQLGLKRLDAEVLSPEVTGRGDVLCKRFGKGAGDGDDFELPMPIHQQERLYEQLQAEHPNVDEQLIRMALKCSHFRSNLARDLLATVNLHPKPNRTEQVKVPAARPLDTVYVTTRGTQTGCLIDYAFGCTRIKRKSSKSVRT